MFITIEQLADLIDGCELRRVDQDFDEDMGQQFLTEIDHLDNGPSDETDEIYVKVERKMKIRYLCEFFAEGSAKRYKLNLLTKMLNIVQVDGNVFAREFLPTDQIELVGQLNPAALDYQYPASLLEHYSSKFSAVSESIYGEYTDFCKCQPLGQYPDYRVWLLLHLDRLYQEAACDDYAVAAADKILAVEGQLSVLYGIDCSPNSPLWELTELVREMSNLPDELGDESFVEENQTHEDEGFYEYGVTQADLDKIADRYGTFVCTEADLDINDLFEMRKDVWEFSRWLLRIEGRSPEPYSDSSVYMR